MNYSGGVHCIKRAGLQETDRWWLLEAGGPVVVDDYHIELTGYWWAAACVDDSV